MASARWEYEILESHYLRLVGDHFLHVIKVHNHTRIDRLHMDQDLLNFFEADVWTISERIRNAPFEQIKWVNVEALFTEFSQSTQAMRATRTLPIEKANKLPYLKEFCRSLWSRNSLVESYAKIVELHTGRAVRFWARMAEGPMISLIPLARQNVEAELFLRYTWTLREWLLSRVSSATAGAFIKKRMAIKLRYGYEDVEGSKTRQFEIALGFFEDLWAMMTTDGDEVPKHRDTDPRFEAVKTAFVELVLLKAVNREWKETLEDWTDLHVEPDPPTADPPPATVPGSRYLLSDLHQHKRYLGINAVILAELLPLEEDQAPVVPSASTVHFPHPSLRPAITVDPEASPVVTNPWASPVPDYETPPPGYASPPAYDSPPAVDQQSNNTPPGASPSSGALSHDQASGAPPTDPVFSYTVTEDDSITHDADGGPASGLDQN
ncbi:MAG: hypothetical protein M1818_005490 [Claussenomyces sp. TS43310]|nr:MAG: hypothetical protein M1818_005490 [Claussenomyces sp. TS43310]